MNPWFAIPFTILIVLRSIQRNSLTPFGLFTAVLTAIVHSLHPSPLPFTLLGTFFLAGTLATKVHHTKKASLTLSSAGGTSGGEGPRNHVQVLANSGIATVLILIHIYIYGVHFSSTPSGLYPSDPKSPSTILLWGIISNYAAVTADTLSSELGILSSATPRLITTLLPVPRGTNGGVTPAGLLAGAAGAALIAVVSVGVLLTTTGPNVSTTFFTMTTITLLGTLGTLLDSLLGATLQASVIDGRSGKVVEGVGGVKVLTGGRREIKSDQKESSRQLLNTGGRDWLDNNQINVLMAALTSGVGMGVGVWVGG